MTSLLYHCSSRLHSAIKTCTMIALICALCPTTSYANAVVDKNNGHENLNLQYLHLIVLHDGTRQTTIMTPTFTRPKNAKRIVMIIPVPAQPIHYGTLDAGLSRDVGRFIRLVRHDAPVKLNKDALKGASIESSKYSKQALELPKAHKANIIKLPTNPRASASVDIKRAPGFGPDAAKWIAQWYKNQNAGPLDSVVPKEVLRYYSERNWTFLGITYDLKSAGETLQPITLSFASKRAILPLKWPWSQSPYATRVDFVHTKAQSAESFASLAQNGWEIAGNFGYPYAGPSPGKPLGINLSTFTTEQSPSKLKRGFRPWFKPKTKLFIRTLMASSMEGKRSPRKWTEDWAVPTPESQKLMADTTPPEAPKSSKSKSNPKAKPDWIRGGKPPFKGAKSPKAPTKKLSKTTDKTPRSGCATTSSNKTTPVSLWLLVFGSIYFWRRRD